MFLSLAFSSCYIGNRMLNILNGIRLTLLHVSILYATSDLFWLLLVSIFVVATGLMILKLRNLIFTASMAFFSLISFPISCSSPSVALICTRLPMCASAYCLVLVFPSTSRACLVVWLALFGYVAYPIVLAHVGPWIVLCNGHLYLLVCFILFCCCCLPL